MIEIKIKGLDTVQAAIAQMGARATAQAAAALEAEAEIEMTEAKRRTPVDTGVLRASGHVKPVSVTPGGAIEVVLAFNTPYAIHVHENLESFHPVGQAKFLESVLVESAPYLATRVATRMRRASGG